LEFFLTQKDTEKTQIYLTNKHFLLKNLPEEDEQRIIQRDLLLKHSSFLNNGSQTVRNRNKEVLEDSSLSNDKGKIQLLSIIDEVSLPGNPSLSYHRKHKKQKKMKMMILKHGRIMNENMKAANKFHYFPDESKILQQKSKKKLKNSKSRTRYAEYDQKDETIDHQI